MGVKLNIIYNINNFFFNKLKNQQQVVQVIGKSANQALELKIRLFEVLYQTNVERW